MKWRHIVALTAATVFTLMTGASVTHSAPATDPTESGTGVSPAIIGGKPGSEEYRFHASLQTLADNRHRCGGAMIQPRWIVTAAHCVASIQNNIPVLKDPNAHRIVIGSNDIQAARAKSIKAFHKHPQWLNGQDGGHDIGLIELPVGVQQITPIKSIPAPKPGGDEVMRMIGWGTTVNGGDPALPRLVQEVDSRLLNPEDCKFGNEFDLAEGDVCVEQPNGGTSGACRGDSGSPLLWKVNGVWRIVGVVSRDGATTNPLCLTTPEVYTTTESHQQWINETIKSVEG